MSVQKLIENYLDTENYGVNLILKEYCNFPKFLPLPCHVEHGWTPLLNALVTDLEIAKSKGLMLVYNQRREKAWQEASKIPVLISGAPFAIYRKMKKIKQTRNAKGTIVFPSHSTLFIDAQFDIDKYCQTLKKLPKEFHPITICLLYPDIKRGKDKIYEKNGFTVVSAGEKIRGSINFVRNYYNILSHYKFATSNEVGSYAFYAVEMGIPFFLTGEEPTIINIDNKDPNIAPSGKMSDHYLGKKVSDIFGYKPITKISNKHFLLVESEFALKDHASQKEIKKALFDNTKSAKYWLVKVPMFWIMSAVKFIVPMKLAYFLFEKMHKKKS